jgi:hypothetical protein
MKDGLAAKAEYVIRPILTVSRDGPKSMYTYLMNWDQRVLSGCGGTKKHSMFGVSLGEKMA